MYSIEHDSGSVFLSAPGLEEEYLLSDFPPNSTLAAIATYLVVQLETESS